MIPDADQLSLKKDVLAFARKELGGDGIARDQAAEFWWEGWRKCAGFGIQGLPFPAEYGGGEIDRLGVVLAMEALGSECRDSGLIFSINAHMWACAMPIWQFGTDAQKSRYLPRMITGELVGAHGASEPDSGSDVHSMRTRVVRRGDGYVLNGTKTFVTNAPLADVFLVFGTLDPGSLSGVTAFLIEKGTKGFSVSREIPKMGLRTSPMGELVLDGCEVPAEARLGAEGGGMGVFNSSMVWERSCILAAEVGVMERQLNACVKYAKLRHQFGSPIGRFQQVAARVADMRIRLETCRALLYRVAAAETKGIEAVLQAAIAKAYISESAVQSGLDAIQIHGGYGYAVEGGVERDLRDALGGRIYSGTTEIQKNIIARCLGL